MYETCLLDIENKCKQLVCSQIMLPFIWGPMNQILFFSKFSAVHFIIFFLYYVFYDLIKI